MRILVFAACAVYFLSLCSCEKNNCQTFLQGAWRMQLPIDTSINLDSVFFYKGDSIQEKFTYVGATDTFFNSNYSSYFITDKCDEIDFNGYNSWTKFSSTAKYSILLITPHDFQFRSKADSSTCTSCIVALHR